MQGTIECKSKLSQWREKAKRRSKEIGALKKRNKEILESRDKWKEKYKREKTANRGFRKIIAKASKKELEGAKGKQKPKHHSYSVQIILLCIWIRQQGNCSLRSCASVLRIVSVVLGLELSFPSRSSIQNWEKKLGYRRIHKRGEAGEDWVLILDESISIGQQKLLLILGIELSKYSFDQALSFKEVEVLYMGIGKSWKGERISEEAERIKAKGYSIQYGVSDGGTNLGKGLRMSDILQVQDCTHAIGNLLKKQYGSNEQFIAFSKQCGVLKRQVMLGKDALIMPPAQRVKGRFLNLQPLSDWAYKMLLLLKNKNSMLSDEQKEKLEWLEDYRTLILEIYEQVKTMNQLFSVLKREGLSEQSSQKCNTILKTSKAGEFFKDGVQQYLEKNLKVLSSDKAVICCSDIIESYFGKYKNQLAKTGSQLITDSCLCIANFNQNFDGKEIKKAMEEVKIVDLKDWRQENLPSSLLQQKRKLLKSVG
ncbi:MAG: hypothetical protein GY705_03135 [Bacteroidetes bacterium]|nr:hypothetical protein [Bacteroidota bacterium]